LSGGPTKIELSAHRDATFNPEDKTAPAPPCLLNYWRGSHYGGTNVTLAAGEEWTKVIGPFAIYCNAGASADVMWKDALGRSAKETAAWPYDFVKGVDYPLKEQRGTVSGQLVLKDPAGSTMPGLRVGLTVPDYTVKGWRGGTETIDWQKDAKHYEFWVRGVEDGRFSIPNVRPGTYTLHAFADSVLGEYAKADVKVEAGKTLDLGKLEWTPVRYGREVWAIGVPDRTAGEFLHGDRPWQWGLYLQYPKDFPNDVHYVVGKSDWHKNWNLMQVPRAAADDTNGRGKGTATPWTVEFEMKDRPAKGKATLRLAFAGTEARSLGVAVNGTELPAVTGLPNTSSIHRDSNTSWWEERDVAFDAALLKEGKNTLMLTVPAGSVTAGVMYDYLRLEVDEGATK
jgi:rhamnogalacturonan endolyase